MKKVIIALILVGQNSAFALTHDEACDIKNKKYDEMNLALAKIADGDESSMDMKTKMEKFIAISGDFEQAAKVCN